MSVVDAFRGWLWNFLMPGEQADQEFVDRLKRYESYRDYYEGRHKRQLKHKASQADDNLVENYASLIIERSISMLLGDGLKFELPTDNEQTYVDEVMKANRYNILFHEAAQNAAVYGTGFIKLVPKGVESKDRENEMLTRLVALDSRWMKIVTPAEDIGKVTGYEMRFNISGPQGQIARKEITRINSVNEFNQPVDWTIENYFSDSSTGGRWEPMGEPVLWEYEFPPIVHWKNLPQANDCYGQSDLEDMIELQDRINFVSSNISKIIRYHGHPKTWGRGAGLGNQLSWGADEIVLVTGQDAMLQNLEMSSDLDSSRQYRNDLKAALFDISRTVDLSSMKDKVGQLTNFGLRVLYNDALDKNATKQDLFGEAILETIHRLLVLENKPTDPGKLIWPDPLPVNETEQNQSDQFDIEHNLTSKETIATRRGYDWEKEQERISAEKVSEDTIGALVLRAFERGNPSA